MAHGHARIAVFSIITDPAAAVRPAGSFHSLCACYCWSSRILLHLIKSLQRVTSRVTSPGITSQSPYQPRGIARPSALTPAVDNTRTVNGGHDVLTSEHWVQRRQRSNRPAVSPVMDRAPPTARRRVAIIKKQTIKSFYFRRCRTADIAAIMMQMLCCLKPRTKLDKR